MNLSRIPVRIMQILRSIAGLCLLNLYLPSAMAWGLLGHQLVCDIAWRSLHEDARRELQELLDATGARSFATACFLPDQLRDREEWAWTKPYHYLNVPIAARRVNPADCPAEGCVLRGVELYLRQARDPAANINPRQRLNNLLFLSHYVADIHQPLHVSYSHDRGGNLTQVIFEGKRLNLHELWDGKLLTRDKRQDWKTLGERLARTAERREIPDSTPLDWANESLALTRRIYAELPADGRLVEDYFDRYQPLAIERITLAGQRLGLMLDTLLSDQRHD